MFHFRKRYLFMLIFLQWRPWEPVGLHSILHFLTTCFFLGLFYSLPHNDLWNTMLNVLLPRAFHVLAAPTIANASGALCLPGNYAAFGMHWGPGGGGETEVSVPPQIEKSKIVHNTNTCQISLIKGKSIYLMSRTVLNDLNEVCMKILAAFACKIGCPFPWKEFCGAHVCM
jgi:hypothetical protein